MKVRKVSKIREYAGNDSDGNYIAIYVYEETIWDGPNTYAAGWIYTTADSREITRRKKDGTTWVALEIAPYDSALLSEGFVKDADDKPSDPSNGTI
jgi:hypothetical protein